MYKLTFFVHTSGWKNGGYENTHYFKNKKEAQEQVKNWNHLYETNGNGAYVEILKLEYVDTNLFREDYIGEL